MKRFLLLVSYCVIYFLSNANIPVYYQNIDRDSEGMRLKQELSNLIISTHVRIVPYTSGYYTDIWQTLKMADLDPENFDNVLLIYGSNDEDDVTNNDRSRSKDLSCHSNSCTGMWVREHVYSKSWGTPNLGTELAGSDAHNLRPVDAQRNISRSNRKFARGMGDAHITSQGYWYPGDEWKGDVARTIMYMYLRYPSQCDVIVAGEGESTFSLDDDMLDLFLEWNAEDPVSELEKNRNEVIYQLQGNRNPFIDHPYFATLIWNGPEAEKGWEDDNSPTTVKSSVFSRMYVYTELGKIYLRNLPDEKINFQLYHIDGRLLKSGRADEVIEVSQLSSSFLILLLEYQGEFWVKKIHP